MPPVEFQRRLEKIVEDAVLSNVANDVVLTEQLAKRIEKLPLPYEVLNTIANSQSEIYYLGRLIRAFKIVRDKRKGE
jgi:hypothetical protein